MPPISGSISSPEPVGVAPFTTWRKSGRYVTDPNIAKPTTSATIDVTVNARFANSRSGSTGSAARRSTSTKANEPGGGERDEPEHHRRAPRVARAAEIGHEDDRAE